MNLTWGEVEKSAKNRKNGNSYSLPYMPPCATMIRQVGKFSDKCLYGLVKRDVTII